MSSHDSFAASGSSPTRSDFICENHGSIFLLRPVSPASYERIDGKLDVRVLLFSRLGLVIENLQIPIANLQEVDVSGNEVIIKFKRESPVAIISDVLAREVYRDFDCDGGGVVDEHESLERLMAFLVRRCGGKHECRKSRCIVFFPRDGNRDPDNFLRAPDGGGVRSGKEVRASLDEVENGKPAYGALENCESSRLLRQKVSCRGRESECRL